MPILIVVAAVEPHNWNGIGGEGVEIAGNAVGDSIFIELQGASDDDAVVLGIIAVIIALIETDDATITKLDVGAGYSMPDPGWNSRGLRYQLRQTWYCC